jgi:dihydrofolate reductase
MRNVILFMLLSLDGYVSGPNGALDWALMDEEAWEYIGELQSEVDAALFGRATYEGFASYWPTVAENASSPKVEREYARWLDTTPKFVFSKTLEQATWKHSTVLKGDIGEEIARLKQQPGSNLLLFGGASIAQACVKQGLIDDYRLLVHPVVLGSGQPLWKEVTDRCPLNLIQARTFRSGIVGLSYRSGKE